LLPSFVGLFTSTQLKGITVSSEYKTLLIGGRGNIGAGLRTYLPRLDERYRIVSVDLPGAKDKVTAADAQRELVDLDIASDPAALSDLISGFDLVVYLARKGNLAEMNQMTDLVFEAVLAQTKLPMVVASSSVHAVDGLYDFYQKDSAYWTMADRDFSAINPWPGRIAATTPAHATNDYGREKEYAEQWCKRMAAKGHGAIAARWGGINERNAVAEVSERGYFSVWCHQEDAARFVHACYQSYLNDRLPSGAHYFVISDNTYNIFDIETPRREIGYEPVHNAETYY
jgi:nucleoside-diphosphate-sugar epimerase